MTEIDTQEDPHRVIHLYEGDGALIVREGGNMSLFGVKHPALRAGFESAIGTQAAPAPLQVRVKDQEALAAVAAFLLLRDESITPEEADDAERMDSAIAIVNEYRAALDLSAPPQIAALEAGDWETCSFCMGSGYGGHPDSGALCHHCSGQGGVKPQIAAPEAEIVKLRGERDEARGADWAYLRTLAEAEHRRLETEVARLTEALKRHEADREYIIGWNDGFEFAASETFKFPAMLRKMWSGTEVQNWLDAEFARVASNHAALKESTNDKV